MSAESPPSGARPRRESTLLARLPPELLPVILSHLTRREAAGAKGACRQLRDACRALESEDPSPSALHHRLRLVVACSSTAEVVVFSLRGRDPPAREPGVGRAWAKSDRRRRFTRKGGPWLTGVALRGKEIFCQCYHEDGLVVLDADTLGYKRTHRAALKPPAGCGDGPGRFEVQGPEGVAISISGDKIFSTYADGKVGCTFLSDDEGAAPMDLARYWTEEYATNVADAAVLSQGSPSSMRVDGFCNAAKASDGRRRIYAALGHWYDRRNWATHWEEEINNVDPAENQAWKNLGPCCFNVHRGGVRYDPTFDEEQDWREYEYVAWGADVGPDGALYVAVDRGYHSVEGLDHVHDGNYTTPPPPCAYPGCGVAKTGVIMRVVFAEGGIPAVEPERPIIAQEFFAGSSAFSRDESERIARPSGVCFTPDGDMLVASMDGRVTKWGGPLGARRGRFLGVFHSLRARDEAARARDEAAGRLPSRLRPLQPMDVWAPRHQGGRVFISVHRGLDAGDDGVGDAGVVVCDRDGREIDFIGDERLAVHCNAVTGE